MDCNFTDQIVCNKLSIGDYVNLVKTLARLGEREGGGVVKEGRGRNEDCNIFSELGLIGKCRDERGVALQ